MARSLAVDGAPAVSAGLLVRALENGPCTPPARHRQQAPADGQRQCRKRLHLSVDQLNQAGRHAARAYEADAQPQTAFGERVPGFPAQFGSGIGTDDSVFHGVTCQVEVDLSRARHRSRHGRRRRPFSNTGGNRCGRCLGSGPRGRTRPSLWPDTPRCRAVAAPRTSVRGARAIHGGARVPLAGLRLGADSRRSNCSDCGGGNISAFAIRAKMPSPAGSSIDS